jgi:hypothetical protein
MKNTLFSCILLVSTSLGFAAPPTDTSGLPAPVQERIREWKGAGKVESVKTRQVDGQTVYEVGYKERGEEKAVWITSDGRVIKEESAGGPGKGRGKAKGHDKNKSSDGDDEVVSTPPRGTAAAPAAAPQSTSTTKAPPATPTASAPQPVPTATAPQAPASAQPKSQDPVKTPAQATAASKEAAREAIKRFDVAEERIKRLAESKQGMAAGMAAIQKETGVAAATLEAQRKSFDLQLPGLLTVNEIAKASGKSVADLMKERRKVGTWQKLAAGHQYDLSALAGKMERVEASMQTALSQKKK